MEEYNKIKKILALGFMHFLDENRPEGKMCLSNGECAEIEKAFNEQDWQKLTNYLDKYIESEDERMLREIKRYIKEQGDKPTGLPNGTVAVYDMISWLEKQKESLHIPETCKDNADSFTDNVIEVRSFQRGIEEGRRLEREKQKERSIPLEESIKAIPPINYDIEASAYNYADQFADKGTNYIEIRDAYKAGAYYMELKQKEQKPIAESKRLANEVIKYLTKCGYSPVLKDDSKKEHFHIDIPRHEDDFWLSEEYKHCRSVLGEYYMEGDYGGDTYTLYVWREKKETKPAEWSEDNIKELTEFEAAMLHIGMSFFGGSAGLNPNNTNEVKKQAKLLLELVPKQEWGEKDNIMLENTILCLKEYCLTDEITWLKSLRPQIIDSAPLYTIEQVDEKIREAQGWSEEDEACSKLILRELEQVKEDSPDYSRHFTRLIDWFTNWLKSRRPHPKAELTLLDENIIEAAVAFVEQNDHFNVWRGIDKHTVLKALRSLKPHWKPSEEQMKALKEAADMHWEPDGLDPLYSLYEDLKKL